MKKIYMVIVGIFLTNISLGQQRGINLSENQYISIVKGSPGSHAWRVELKSDVDIAWSMWDRSGYSFGFNPAMTPMYTTINGIISTPYMIQVRGNAEEKNKKRWGYHVFEGYAADDRSRITMLVNKHIEHEKPVAEMYYYGTAYNHSAPAYNWFRIGSDVRNHSYLFSRDKAIFYGSLKLTNTITLGNIGATDVCNEAPEGDDEANFEQSARHVNYVALKEGGDGTMFYDKDNDIVVIKINGEWMRMAVKPLPKHIKYEFE